MAHDLGLSESLDSTKSVKNTKALTLSLFTLRIFGLCDRGGELANPPLQQLLRPLGRHEESSSGGGPGVVAAVGGASDGVVGPVEGAELQLKGNDDHFTLSRSREKETSFSLMATSWKVGGKKTTKQERIKHGDRWRLARLGSAVE